MTTTASHKFSRVSTRDALAFGAANPGFPLGATTREQASEWTALMKAYGIQGVLGLLDDDEKASFFPYLDINAEM